MNSNDLTRRSLIAAAAFATMVQPVATLGQVVPGRPVRLIVPFVAGGGTDAIGRIIAQRLSQLLSVPVIVENRAGANGNIGAEAVVRAEPDGHTLLFATAGVFAVNQSLYRGLSFSTARDLAPVTGVYDTGNVLLVRKGLPAQNVAELIALAKSQPGRLNFASGGSGSSSHMFGELFQQATEVQMQHVPYRSNGPAMNDLLAGTVDVFFDQVPSGAPQVQAGSVRALAVTTKARSLALPEIATFSELGFPALTGTFWVAMAAPAKTPAATVAELNRAVRAILEEPAIKDRFAGLGADPMPTTPDDLGRMIVEDTRRWEAVVRKANLQP